MTTFEQRKKEEFLNRQFGVIKDTAGKTRNYIFLEDAWSFFSQSLSDYSQQVKEEVLKDLQKVLYTENGFLREDDNVAFDVQQKVQELLSNLSLLQKDKENK